MTTSVDSWCYVFGIVPSGAPVPAPDDEGPAAGLRLVEVGEVAALVGPTPADRGLGRAADLLAHDRVLAEVVAAGTPVVPMRFGAVVTDEAAVAEELLGAHHDRFVGVLDALRGRVQYTVNVRYEQDTVLRQVLDEHPEIARLRETDDQPEGRAAFDRRLRLGELVVRALERLRPADAAAVLEQLGDDFDFRAHHSTAPDEVLDAAFLVETARVGDFEARVEDLGRRNAGRLRVRLVGPSPAYDFVEDV
jgi:Gas vesicle synthesis protein GvpL/GvpF